MKATLSKANRPAARHGVIKKVLLWQLVAGAVVWSGLLALAPLRALAQNADEGPTVEVVPIIAGEQWTGLEQTPEWMAAFPGYAQRFWDNASNRRLLIQFRLGQAIRWQRCADCLVSAFDDNTLAPWIVQLAQRQQRQGAAAPQAYLLLAPKGGIEGAGFYIPEKIIAADFGVAGFDLMAASGPQAALHEVGHFLKLPDRYDPHGGAGRALTLMGWIDDPVSPLDPVLRVERGWAAARSVQLGDDPETKTLYPEDAIKINAGHGAIWLGLQPIPGVNGPSGWLFEIDWTGPERDFERVTERLLARSELDRGQRDVVTHDAVFDISWRFIPDPSRMQVTMRRKPLPTVEPPQATGCGVTPLGHVDWGLPFAVFCAALIALGARRQRV